MHSILILKSGDVSPPLGLYSLVARQLADGNTFCIAKNTLGESGISISKSEFEQELAKYYSPLLQKGKIYKFNNDPDDVYILAVIDNNKYSFISLRTGNRWSAPETMEDLGTKYGERVTLIADSVEEYFKQD